MNEKIKKVLNNPYFKITVAYCLAHFFMLILTGCWWDDLTFITHDLNYINVVASESGRPEWNILVPFCWSLPNNGRILLFFMFYLNSLFVYIAMKNSRLFDESEALLITLVFSVVPVDDARILISNFAYSVGLFFFYLSLMLFMFWNKMKQSWKKNLCRVGLLILFFISFILNSVLAYYYILIAYLFVIDVRSSKEQNIIKRILLSVKNVILKYPDFFIWPFVYYGFNKTFFPTHGETFGNYNAVTLNGLIKCFLYIPISVVGVFTDIIGKSISCINIYTLIFIVLSVACAVYLSRNVIDKKRTDVIKSLRYLAYGLFVLIMGVFPYVMVRSRRIDTMGVKGRDAVLLPLGVSIIVLSVLILLKKKARTCALALVLSFGINSMNSLYLEWQKDYYYQISLERLFDNDIIRNNDTFFVIDLNETEIEAQRYYSLNANAFRVYGDQTRFFMPKVSNLYILEEDDAMREAIEAIGYSHMMRDYAPDDYNFDAILNYTNYYSWEDTVKLKYWEMFDQARFKKAMEENGRLDIYIVEDDFTKKLLKEYDSGNLHGDEDVLELVLDYAG